MAAPDPGRPPPPAESACGPTNPNPSPPRYGSNSNPRPKTPLTKMLHPALEAIEEPADPEPPLRIPTQLLPRPCANRTSRYPHRVSRRTRRRGRPDGPDFQQRGDHPREPRPQESRPDVRPDARPDVRPDARPVAPAEAARLDKPAMVSISDLLREGQEIIVQIAKEPLGQKGARITSHIALPGRFLVYMPTVDHIGVSRKIPSDERTPPPEGASCKPIRSGIPGGFTRTAHQRRRRAH